MVKQLITAALVSTIYLGCTETFGGNSSKEDGNKDSEAMATILDMGGRLCSDNVCWAKENGKTVVWMDFNRDFCYEIKFTRSVEDGRIESMTTLNGKKGEYRIVIEFTDGSQCTIDDTTSCTVEGDPDSAHFYYKDERLLSTSITD